MYYIEDTKEGLIMKLGIISKELTQEAFISAKTLNLDFVEFCINGGDDGSVFLALSRT